MNWIPCAERMPELDTYVLTWNGFNVHESKWDSGKYLKKPVAKWHRGGGGNVWTIPTHWMPLPDPPK